jgi:hypothetical protein
MDKVLKQIEEGKFSTPPLIKRRFQPYPRTAQKTSEERKQQWYAIGKVICEGHKVKLHNESKLSAKRTYIYYQRKQGWDGPSPRQFGKMNETQFQLELAELEILESFSTEAEGPAFLEEENLLTAHIDLGEVTDTPRDQESWGTYDG